MYALNKNNVCHTYFFYKLVSNMLQNGKIGGGGMDGGSQILNIFKYGRVVCQIEHTEKTKKLPLKILTSKVISRSFWGRKYCNIA